MISLLLLLLQTPTQHLSALQDAPTQLFEFSESSVVNAEPVAQARHLSTQAIRSSGLGGDVALFKDQGHSLTAYRVLFQRTSAGIPIRDSFLKVVLWNTGGATVEIENSLAPRGNASAQLSAEQAVQIATPFFYENSSATQNIFPQTPSLQWHQQELIYSAPFRDAEGQYDFEVLVHAHSGIVLGLEDNRVMVDGHGAVFIPNPVQSMDDHTLKDQGNSAGAVPSTEYVDVVLQGLDGSGYLTGPHVSTSPTSGRVKNTSLNFYYNRSQGGFEETMVYYHLDEFQRYIQSLGMNNANNRQQRVKVNGTGQDNSWYTPSSKQITFGKGGVDDAEDADIIVHEYGHALHHDLQGSLPNGENGSMGEGYGDFYAALFYDDPLVGEWDAVSYSSGPYHYLRRTDLNLHYPEDKNNQVHHDGQIWSASLWDIRIACGRDVALTLTIEGCALQSPNSNMRTASSWIRRAERQIYGGTWLPFVAWAQHKRGFLDLEQSIPAVLNVSDSSLPNGRGCDIYLSAPSYAGAGYQILPSLLNVGGPAGSPFNVDLNIGVDGVQYSSQIPGGIGNLDASGDAMGRISIPTWIGIDTSIFLQAVIFDATTGNIATNPAAIRGVIH